MHSVGFIGLGNVCGKLAGSLLRNKCGVMVRDLDRDVAAPFLEARAKWADSPKAMGEASCSTPQARRTACRSPWTRAARLPPSSSAVVWRNAVGGGLEVVVVVDTWW